MIYKTVYDDETKHTHILVVKPADASGRSSVLVATAKGHTHLASSRMPSPTEIQAHTDEQGNVDPTVFILIFQSIQVGRITIPTL